MMGRSTAWILEVLILTLLLSSGCRKDSSDDPLPPPGKAGSPTPSDGATGVAQLTLLTWDAVLGATSYDVYFGTTNPPPFQGVLASGPSYGPGPLGPLALYYWRIDSVNGAGTTVGDVWSFTTLPDPPAQATNPSPWDEEGDVVTGTTLSWDPAPGADSYDVYFGAASPGAFIGNQAGTVFDSGPLTFPERYFWRIDTVNVAGTTTGGAWTFSTFARGEDRTLVIENLQSPISQAIAGYYLSLRPMARLLTLDVAPQETVNRATYDNDIRIPVEDYLTAGGLVDEIWFIVTTKGVPLRVSGNAGSTCVTDERASVDSELSHLLRPLPLGIKTVSPYFNSQVRFSRPTYDMYLVSRLTGYETDVDLDGIPDDVKALMDRGFAPIPGSVAALSGKFVLDEWPPRGVTGNDWMQFAASDLQGSGYTVVHDQTNTFLRGETDVLGYASWGSNDGDSGPAPYMSGHTYIDGAVVTTYVSTNARSFQTGTNYGQSLVADLILEGVTGANGHCFEPCLDAVSRPHILLDRYLRGWSLVESYYAANRFYSWMNVVVGDPLCAPWTK